MAVSTTAKPGENAAGAIKRIESFVAETIEPKLGLFERMTARQQFSFLLGLVELPDSILANNPYGVAFSLGRRDQLDMSSAAPQAGLGRASPTTSFAAWPGRSSHPSVMRGRSSWLRSESYPKLVTRSELVLS